MYHSQEPCQHPRFGKSRRFVITPVVIPTASSASYIARISSGSRHPPKRAAIRFASDICFRVALIYKPLSLSPRRSGDSAPPAVID